MSDSTGQIHRLLVVDDHVLVLKALRKTLARRYTVWAAATVDEALRIASEVELDVVVTDLELADPDGRDGIWLLERLQVLWGLRGLVLTGDCEDRDGVLVLYKPVSPETLHAAIDQLVARRPAAPQV